MRWTSALTAILVGLLFGAAVAEPPSNLLANGTFDANASGWEPGSDAEGVAFDWSKNGGRGGSGALHAVAKPAAGDRPWIWWGFVEKPPTDSALKISGWIRGKGVQTLAAVCVQAWAGEKRDAGFATTATDRELRGDFEWTHVETILPATPGMDRLAVLAFTVGGGEAWFDDLRVERTDDKPPSAPTDAPGLSLTRGEFEIVAQNDDVEPRLLVPVPMSYREQVPLTYALAATPPESLVRAIVHEDRPGNFIVDVHLRKMARREKVRLAWRSLVLCGERSYDGVPEQAPIPAKWPDEATPWLRATACVQSGDPRLVAIGSELREGTSDVREVLRRVERRAREIFQAAKGESESLDALTALDRRGSCTSRANLVAALLRSAGVPARVLAGTPLWSGPLQTHYVVEAFVPGYGWYLIESTMLKFPTQPYEQVEVSIVPPDYEDRSGARPGVAGGVPYLSLDECASPGWWRVGAIDREKNCGHVATIVRGLPTEHADADWAAALVAARLRWAAWLKEAKLDASGRLATALQPDDVKSTTAAELAVELRR